MNAYTPIRHDVLHVVVPMKNEMSISYLAVNLAESRTKLDHSVIGVSS